jgi:hypothetical protein
LFITEELLWQANERGLEEAKDRYLKQLRFDTADRHVTLTLDASALSSAQFQDRIQAEINQFMPLESRDRIVFLLDAEQNPKNNLKTRVKVIREVAGDEVGLLFLLIHEEHEPMDEDSERCRIWKYAVHRWNDPNIHAEDFKPGTKE